MRLIVFSAGRCPARRIDLRPGLFLAKRGLAASRCGDSHLPRPFPSLLALFSSAFVRFLFSAQRRPTDPQGLFGGWADSVNEDGRIKIIKWLCNRFFEENVGHGNVGQCTLYLFI